MARGKLPHDSLMVTSFMVRRQRELGIGVPAALYRSRRRAIASRY
jgi:hypothetical protein